MAVENSTVLIIVNNWGIEETELTRPLRDLKAAGAKVTLAATTLDPCETVQHDRYVLRQFLAILPTKMTKTPMAI